MKIINDTSILSTLKSTFTASCEKSPHCLMQLSTTEWDRCAKNSIQLKGLLYCDITSYESVTFGNNVTAPLKKSTTHGDSIRWNEINIAETTNQYAIIVTTVTDLASLIGDGSVILIDSTEGSSIGRGFNDKSSLSEFVLLAVMQLNKKITGVDGSGVENITI